MISIIVPVFNQVSYTKGFVKSLEETITVPFELIFIDNGSTDETLIFLDNLAYEFQYKETKFKEVVVIKNKVNEGIFVAFNQGLQTARYSRILICNNDIQFRPNWDTELLKFIDSDKEIGMVGPQAHYPYDTGDWLTKSDESIAVGIHGCCFMLKKEMLEGLKRSELGTGEPYPGVFDRNYFAYWGDCDFVKRVRRIGWKVLSTSKVWVYHFGARTIDAWKESGKDYQFGREKFFKKFLPPTNCNWTVSMSLYFFEHAGKMQSF